MIQLLTSLLGGGAAGGAAGAGASAGIGASAGAGSLFSKILGLGGQALKDPRVQQIISALGANLAGEGSAADTMNQITQQRIRGMSHQKMLEHFTKMLSGEFGEKDKMTSTRDGTKIEMGSLLSGQSTGEFADVGANVGPGAAGLGGSAGLEKIRTANPFVSSPLGTSANLAGLTAAGAEIVEYEDVKGKVFGVDTEGKQYISNNEYIFDPSNKMLYRKDNWTFGYAGGNVAIGPSMGGRPGIEPLQEFVTTAGAGSSGQELDWESEYTKGIEALMGEEKTSTPIPTQSAQRKTNPFTGISAADLVGLSPQDISSALSGALSVKALEQKKVTDLIDSIYKKALIEEGQARTAKIKAGDPLDKPFVGNLTQRQFSSLTPDAKEFALAKEGARLLGDDDFMTKREWEETKPTERQKFLQGMIDKPEHLAIEKELRQASIAPSQPKTPSPVTWTTATKELTKRFGKLDPTGMWAVTDELSATHRKSQELLVELKDSGVDPLRAVNEAETKARDWTKKRETRYFQYLDAAQNIRDKTAREEQIDKIKNAFFEQYGYIPTEIR